jgi:hypothetical protein
MSTGTSFAADKVTIANVPLPVTGNVNATITNTKVPVTISNTSASPIYTADSKRPLQLELFTTVPAGSSSLQKTVSDPGQELAVPQGRMWVIENISAHFDHIDGNALSSAALARFFLLIGQQFVIPIDGGYGGNVTFRALLSRSPSAGTALDTDNIQTKLYLLPGANIQVSLVLTESISSVYNGDLSVDITGYSVPYP